MSRPRKRTARQVLRDIGLYLVIGGAVGAGALLYVVYLPRELAPDFKWLGLIVNTPVTFGLPLWGLRSYRRVPQFWLALVLLLVIHLVVYSVMLRKVEHFGLLWYSVLNPFEWAVIIPVLQWAGQGKARFSTRSKDSRRA